VIILIFVILMIVAACTPIVVVIVPAMFVAGAIHFRGAFVGKAGFFIALVLARPHEAAFIHGMLLAGLICAFACEQRVTTRRMRMMGRPFGVAGGMMFGRFAVMMGGAVMMGCGIFMKMAC